MENPPSAGCGGWPPPGRAGARCPRAPGPLYFALFFSDPARIVRPMERTRPLIIASLPGLPAACARLCGLLLLSDL